MKAPAPVRILAPAGTHVARVVQIIYIGTVKGEYKGVPNELYKLRLTWELPNELRKFKEDESERPFVVSKEFTLSMGKKSSLRPIVEGMIGTSLDDEEAREFDIDDLLGKECMLSITHDKGQNGEYVKINSASTLMKGIVCPPAINTIRILSYDKWNEDYFQSLPEFIKDKMVKTKEFKIKHGLKVEESPNESEAISPDDIPF